MKNETLHWIGLGVVLVIAIAGTFTGGDVIEKTQVIDGTEYVELAGSTQDDFGIGTSSAHIGNLGIGTAQSTSTIATGKICFASETETGSPVYVYLSGATGSALDWATSTTACN